jgi:ribosomal protein S21
MPDSKQDKKPIILPENVPMDFTFEKMLKSFLKEVEKNGILKEVKERRYYQKPSEIRHKIEGTIKSKQKIERRKKGENNEIRRY